MANFDAALLQLHTEREQTELQVKRLDQAISAIESLNGSGTSRNGNQLKRLISAASRRKMARAQKARRAREHGYSDGRTTNMAPRRTVSASARRKIAAAQRARWAKVRAQQKAA